MPRFLLVLIDVHITVNKFDSHRAPGSRLLNQNDAIVCDMDRRIVSDVELIIVNWTDVFGIRTESRSSPRDRRSRWSPGDNWRIIVGRQFITRTHQTCQLCPFEKCVDFFGGTEQSLISPGC